MSRQFLLVMLAAVAVIGVAIYSTVSVNQNHLLTLTGAITDVRVEPLTQEASLVIVDFTANNPSEVGFDLIKLELEGVDGEKVIPSGLLTKSEIARFAEYKQFAQPNPVLGIGEMIRGGQTVNRMIAGRFELPLPGLAQATYRIRFHHIDKVEAQIEGRKP